MMDDKKMNEKERNIIIAAIFIITVILTVIVIKMYINKDFCGCDKCIMIPDRDMIENFCQAEGYENGWLSSSSCGLNEVQCFKEEGEASYYKCLEFE